MTDNETFEAFKELNELKRKEQVIWILKHPDKTLNIIYYLVEIIKDLEFETGKEILKK